ncbi:retrovirus-related pol polyprotein from transposon TNT 1-94 [Tanacetum coccineum]
MSGTVPHIPPPLGTNIGSPNRVDTMPTTNDTINTTTTTNVAQNVIDENLPQLLDSRGGSHVTNVPEFDKEDITSWKVMFLVFLDGLEPYLLKTLEDGPYLCQIYPLLLILYAVIKCKTAKAMWNDLILAHEGPSDTRDTKIAVLRLKFNAFKALEGKKVNGTFTRLKCLLNDLENNGVIIPQAEASSSKALIFNNQFQDNDSDVEDDLRSSSEFIVDLNAEYHERALLANQKRFYKRSGKVGSARKPMDKSNEICFAYRKQGHFQKDCPSNNTATLSYPSSNKSSTPSHPSSNKSYNKPKTLTHTSPQNSDNHQKDYKGKYKGLKAEIAVLTKKIDAMSKGKSEKGLVVESFDWDKEYVSSMDEGTTKIKAFMAIADKEPSVRKANARSGQWVEITMKKVHRLLSMIVGDKRKHVLDYTQTCSKVTFDQLLSKQIPGNTVKALGGKGNRKEKISSKEVIFIKADESSSMSILEITSDSESECETHEPLPPLPKLIGAAPTGTSNSLISLSNLTLNMADLILNTSVPKKTKPTSDKKADLSAEQLLLTLMDEVKSLKEKIKVPSENSPSVSQTGSSKSSKGKQTTWFGPSKKAPMILKPFKECKYCGFNDHHYDNYEYYPRCEEYLKRSIWVAYVNGLKHNLISISQLCDANFKVLFIKTQGTIFNQNGEVVLIAHRRRDVYVIDMSSYNEEINACFFAKASPKYEYSRYTWVFFLKKKSDAAECIMSFIRKMENLNEVRVKELRSDNGTGFRDHKLEELCEEKGIYQNFSSPSTLKQNCVAKRRNRTMIEATRTMLNSAKLPKIF